MDQTLDQTLRKFLQIGALTFGARFGHILDVILDLNSGIDLVFYFWIHFNTPNLTK